MACGNCSSSTCTGCNVTCVPVGPAGPIGATGPTGPSGPSATLLNSYITSTASIELSNADGNWTAGDTWYQPTGFTTLTYTNSSGADKDFLITVNYVSGISSGTAVASYAKSDVSCGIFLGTDLVNALWEVDAAIQYADADVPTVYNTRQVNNLFHKMTLLNGTTMKVQFQTKGTGDGYLQKAQLFIQEL